MSCSVKSTPIACSRAISAVSRIRSMRSRGAMPAVGSSINKKLGLVGQRDRKLQPLEIAVSELAAGNARREAAMPTRSSKPAGLLAGQPRRRGHQIKQAPADATPARPGHSRALSWSRMVAVIWKVRPTPSRQIARGFRLVVSSPRRWMRPLSGVICPLSMSKTGAFFPAPFGADQRQDLTGVQAERHAAHGVNAAIGFT